MKHVELMCVTTKNNNKFYRMVENGDGTWTATWGRVGNDKSQSKVYPMSAWHRIYDEKVKGKGGRDAYTDVTGLRKEHTSKAFRDVEDTAIMDLLRTLHEYSNKSLNENYTVSSADVTPQQIDKAQDILNNITALSLTDFSNDEADQLLTELYTVIPRKMNNVKNFLLNGETDSKQKLQQIIQREQDSVDNMAQSVSTQTIADTNEGTTLEDALGIKISHVTNEEISAIKQLMGSNADQFVRAFAVTNTRTQALFESQKEKSYKPWTRLLWHGSRNENWLSILNKGLMIRPTGVVLTGAMFGNGVYFANKAQKSIGYTSLSGSYWARGSANQAFLAVYEVNTGMEYRTQSRDNWMGNCDERTIRMKNCDSLFAQAGSVLRNDELIVYNQDQSTIKYIVEIKR